jgi:uncharacterized phiE125 gp8 family phage protein
MTTYPVTLAEAKLHLRVDDSTEESLISLLIAGATQLFQEQTGIQCIDESFVEKFNDFPSAFVPQRLPLDSVTSIKYYDSNGDQQTMAAADYRVSLGTPHTPGRIVPAYGSTGWPSAYDILDAVELTYKAGFGTASTDVPELIRRAILLQVAKWFENREDYERKSSFSAFDDIVAMYKVHHR